MKKYRILWMILLLAVFIAGAGYGALHYFNSGRGQREEPYFGETVLIEKNSFDGFASEIADMMKEYDGETLDEEAFSIPYYSRRLIVQGTGEELNLESYGAKIVVHGPDDMYVMQFTTREAAEEAYTKLQNAENIEYCEPDQYAGGLEGDGDYEAMSWGVEQIGADVYAKHIQGMNNGSIKVAVVDSGVYKHSFLKDRIAAGGTDFVDNDLNPDDKHGHGTHVAGTIVDCTPGLNVKILPVRVLDAAGNGSFLRISLGIRYAANCGVQIVNLSLGNKGQKGISRTVDNAVLYAINRGCTVVAAAGNDNWDVADCSIAHLDRCIVVSAVDSNLQKASFSNWGNTIDVAAPGVNIVSCIPNLICGFTIGGTKKTMYGTSMATPHISALAAMIKLENPSFSPVEVEAEIINHCVDLGEAGWDKYYGWGIPDFSDKSDDVKSDEQFTKDSVQTDPMAVYQEILAEYKMLAENNFDSSLREQIKYANEGVWNFSIQDHYSVYYRLADLAGDGEPELLISVNEKGTPYNIVDIYGIKDGKPVAVIESRESVGYRSRYYITADNRIKNVGSGGALNTGVIYYRLPANSVFLELEDQYVYDGWDGDQYTHTDSTGDTENISKSEYDIISSDGDVDFESEWTLFYDGGSGRQTENTNEKTIPINIIRSDTSASAYQGIFMNGEIFISLPLYTSYEPEEAIGIVYRVTKPVWGENGYIESDIIEIVGEIYALDSGEYEIRGEGITYGLSYYDGEIALTGDAAYSGKYVQVSNSGANMTSSDIWLNIPVESAADEAGEEGISASPIIVYTEDESEYILPNSDSVEITREEEGFLGFYIGEDISNSEPVLCQNDIETALPEVIENTLGEKEYRVHITFNEKGKQILEDVTSEYIGKYMSVVYNNEIICRPVIYDVCANGEMFIIGLASYEEAEHLALILRIDAEVKDKNGDGRNGDMYGGRTDKDTIHGTYTYDIEVPPPSWDALSSKLSWEAEFLKDGMCEIDFCYGSNQYANDPSSYFEHTFHYEVPYTIERDEGIIYLDNSFNTDVAESIAANFNKCLLDDVEIIKE